MRIASLLPGLALWAGLAGLLSSPLSAGDVADCSLVPGWQQDGAARHYTADNLFEYLDGAAESYLLYGFKQLQGVTCVAGENSIVIDASEMTDPESSYGIFLSNRDPRAPLEKIGMNGQVMPQRSAFAKGNSYVELTATPDNDHTPALRAFVAALEQRIAGRSTPPDEIAWFVPDKLVAVRLIPESVLGLAELRRGYVAEYDTGKAFVVTETSADAARSVLERLHQHYPQARSVQIADEAILAQDKYLGWICFFRHGKFVAGSANAPNDSAAQAKAAQLLARLP